MILIADSGSTKCDWALIDTNGNSIGNFQSRGINPYFHSAEIIEKTLCDDPKFQEIRTAVKHVFFYGAGCSTDEMRSIMHQGLSAFFTNAELLVEHDVLGSAMATYDGEKCISCILGTGSNSCYFDGLEVSEEIPSLAYILGDEGSGSYFGKILLQEYFYKKLPQDLHVAFDATFAPDKNEIMNKIYREPHANVYLASFTKFIGQHRDHPHVQKWVTDGFIHFINIHVKCFPNWKDLPVHFVGSIAFHFMPYLLAAADETRIKLGRVVKKPIEGLVAYHVRFKLPQLIG